MDTRKLLWAIIALFVATVACVGNASNDLEATIAAYSTQIAQLTRCASLIDQ